MINFSPEEIRALQIKLNAYYDDCSTEENRNNVTWLLYIVGALEQIPKDRRPLQKHVHFLFLKLFLDSIEEEFIKNLSSDGVELKETIRDTTNDH